MTKVIVMFIGGWPNDDIWLPSSNNHDHNNVFYNQFISENNVFLVPTEGHFGHSHDRCLKPNRPKQPKCFGELIPDDLYVPS